jgi:hypothetical protein
MPPKNPGRDTAQFVFNCLFASSLRPLRTLHDVLIGHPYQTFSRKLLSLQTKAHQQR